MGLLKYLHRRKKHEAKLEQTHVSVQDSSHQGSSHQSSSHQGSSHQSSSHQSPSHPGSSHQISSHEGSSHQRSSHQGSSHQRSSHQGSSHQISSHEGSSHQRSSHQGSSHTSLASLFSRRDSFSSSTTSGTSTLDPEHKRLLEAFRIIDKDGDGKISKQELGMMWQRLGEQVSDEELRYMIQDADGDGDGLVDFHEFIDLQRIMGAEDHEERSKEIRLAFNVADVDKNGCISASELQKVMQKLGQQKVTLDECIAMCQVVDVDGDGMISFEEFERLMKSNAFEDID